MKSWPVRILIAVLLVAAVALAFLSPNVRRGASAFTHPDPVGPTVYSKSALGHAAFYHLLEKFNIPVSISESGAGTHIARGNVLVIAEPRADETTLAEVKAMLTAPAVLLVLPKRVGKVDPKRPNYISDDQYIAEKAAARVLHLADPNATLVRGASNQSWTGPQPFTAPALRSPQLIRGGTLHPILASAGGILIGERRLNGRRLIVLSDPDLIANFNLARGANAQNAVSLIANLLADSDGAVVFDEFVHGFSPRAFQMLGILFEFPFVLITIQIGIAIALAVWSAAGRFGMPELLPPPIEAGKRSLIEAGARLLDRWGRAGALEERYFEVMLRDTAAALRAPRGLDVPGLLAYFSATGRPAPAAGPLQSAQEIYRWRKELLGGSHNHKNRR